MATSLTLENDSSLAQGYIKVNGSTAATLTTSGITGNLTGNADTATKFSTTTGSAPAYACRAWVNFDGTRDSSGAVSTANTNRFIRSSGNVTSVLRNSVGDYTITFTTPMSDANYSIIGMTTGIYANTAFIATGGTYTSSAVRVRTGDYSSNLYDVATSCFQVFGN
jgi:hypothetical protein